MVWLYAYKATDAVVAEGRAPAAPDSHEGVEQRIGGRIPALVSSVSRAKRCGLTPDLEVDSNSMPNVQRIASYQGLRHAEQKLVQWALDRGYYIVSIGAGRPICSECAGWIQRAEQAQPFRIFYQ